MTNFIKTRFNDEVLHVAYDEETLSIIRITNADSKEIVLDDYDTQIILERIVDSVSE